MTGLTDYITAARWEDIFTIWYVLVDDAYQALVRQVGRLRQRGPEPTFSDSEVITIALISDTFFHGHEELTVAFIRQYHRALFPRLLEASRFNRRRRALAGVTEALRRRLNRDLLARAEPVRLVDSAPIPLTTYQRGGECTTVMGPDYCSVMPSRAAKLFGLRLYLTVTLEQVLDEWLLAPAACRDAKVAPVLLDSAHDLYVVGDTAFHDPTVSRQLLQERHMSLLALPRRDTRQPWPAAWRAYLQRLRRPVESALSVLCVVFHIEQPGSRSLTGLLTRLASRLLAYTLSFLMPPFFKAAQN
jgi:hypothetical protein